MTAKASGERGRATGRTRRALVCAGTLVLTIACNDLLTVDNPTQILDEDLESELAVQALVNGVAGDFNWAYHYLAYMSAHLADEMLHTGSDVGIRSPSDGSTTNVPSWSGNAFNRTVLSIFTAVDGAERLARIFDNPQEQAVVGTVQVYAGFAKLMAADNLCQVTIDGSAPFTPAEIYRQAEESFSIALDVANRVGSTTMRDQSLAGRARARIALQDWPGGLADASAVPDGFQFWALYSTNSAREENIIAARGRAALRRESGVHPRYYTDARFQADPRTPFTDRGAAFVGADGSRQFVEQDKYIAQGSDILIASWQEARLLEAEAALRLSDMDLAVALIDEVRVAASLEPYAGPADEESVWEQLIYERSAELWLQAQRLRDLRRTDDPYTQGRDVCFPISEAERASNPNVS